MPTKKDRLKALKRKQAKQEQKETLSTEVAKLQKDVKRLTTAVTSNQKDRYLALQKAHAGESELKQARRLIEMLERRVAHAEKLTADMHNNHVDMRLSLSSIRDLHQRDGDYCAECLNDWPCETYNLIKMPEQQFVTKLLIWERELTDAQEGKATFSEASGDGEGGVDEEG